MAMAKFRGFRRPSFLTYTAMFTTIASSIVVISGQSTAGVSLELLGQTIPNNSLINLDDLHYRIFSDLTPTNANGLQTLKCITDHIDCCEFLALGDWYYPDGSIVTGGGGATFQTNRGQNEVINGQQFYGSVRLWRRFTPSERGLFHCVLPDANGVNQILYVNILFFTRITDLTSVSVAISPSGSTTAGETYSLTCTATLDSRNLPLPDPDIPSPTFQWFFGPDGSASLPSGLSPAPTVLSSGTYTSTLQFSPLSQSHVGNYTCQLGAGSLANSAMVTVNAPALLAQITTSGTPMLGQSYSLTCNVSGAGHLSPTITYQWTKNNGTWTQIQIGIDLEVLSSPLKLSDAGQYTCQATFSSPYLNSDITTVDLQNVTLQIPAPTSQLLSSSIANPIPPFGSDITLICTVVLTSGPGIDVPLDVNFELLRIDPAGSPLTTATPSVSGSTYTTTVTISPFGRSDSGVYTCRATVSSASTSSYIMDSNAEFHSLRVTTGVYLALRDMFIANSSNVNIRSIGQSTDSPNGALQCITDWIPCCLSPTRGEWYLPNRELVQGMASATTFYRSRGDNGEVALNRPSDILSPLGQYCCEVPDATGTTQTLCVNVGTTCGEDGSVRLVDGAHVNEGRLEICVNGVWGTVCNDGLTSNDGFDIDAARVVCQQLGFPIHRASSTTPIHLDNVQCTTAASEPNLLNCSHNGIGVHDCGSNHTEDIGIICQQSQDCTDGSVRLADGDNYNATAGRVEYCVGGRWGTVCNFNWGEADATVVCQQLGLNMIDPKVLTDVPQVKNLLTPIVLDGLNCRGDESNLGQCGREPVVEYCSHANDAGANCTSIIGPPPVQTFCSLVIWSNPQLPCDDIMGYEVRLYNPDSRKEVNRSVDSYSMSYVITDEDKLQVEVEKAFVQVRVVDKVLGARKWSDGVSLGCEAPNEGIHFVHKGQVYLNNSVILLHLIGENENALLCKTDQMECCGTPPNRFGEFYFPYGAKVPIKGHGLGFYRNRGKQEIRLHRREGVTATYPAGRFRCQIPDARGDLQNIYIELMQ